MYDVVTYNVHVKAYHMTYDLASNRIKRIKRGHPTGERQLIFKLIYLHLQQHVLLRTIIFIEVY